MAARYALATLALVLSMDRKIVENFLRKSGLDRLTTDGTWLPFDLFVLAGVAMVCGKAAGPDGRKQILHRQFPAECVRQINRAIRERKPNKVFFCIHSAWGVDVRDKPDPKAVNVDLGSLASSLHDDLTQLAASPSVRRRYIREE